MAPDVVLTAAHCFNGEVESTIAYINRTTIYDASYEYPSPASFYRQHPDFIAETYTNDIALVKLATAITEVTPALLNTNSTIPMVGATLQVMGFGYLTEDGSFPEELQVAEVQEVSGDICTADYVMILPVLPENQVCAAAPGKDSCSGDSGGPLLLTTDESTYIQVGLVSFGNGCAKEVSNLTVMECFFCHAFNEDIEVSSRDCAKRGTQESMHASVNTSIIFKERFVA